MLVGNWGIGRDNMLQTKSKIFKRLESHFVTHKLHVWSLYDFELSKLNCKLMRRGLVHIHINFTVEISYTV